MADWQAQVSRGVTPAERVDAELRYALALPLIRAAGTWVDLGCGTGAAASSALDAEALEAALVLVDDVPQALDEAARRLAPNEPETIAADLQDPDALTALRAALAEAESPLLITAFDLLARLERPAGVVELLADLATAGATVLVNVPDDEAGGVDDPNRRSAWSANAAEEVRRLLPSDAVVLRELAVRAAAIVPAGADEVALGALSVPAGAAATGYLLVAGPGAAEVLPGGRAKVADVAAERSDARRRVSDLAYLEARLAAQP